jgi:hypothetical protein
VPAQSRRFQSQQLQFLPEPFGPTVDEPSPLEQLRALHTPNRRHEFLAEDKGVLGSGADNLPSFNENLSAHSGRVESGIRPRGVHE